MVFSVYGFQGLVFLGVSVVLMFSFCFFLNLICFFRCFCVQIVF